MEGGTLPHTLVTVLFVVEEQTLPPDPLPTGHGRSTARVPQGIRSRRCSPRGTARQQTDEHGELQETFWHGETLPVKCDTAVLNARM